MSRAVIELNAVSKRYDLHGSFEIRRAFQTWRRRREPGFEPGRYALRDIDIRLEHGESLGIVGRNGSGKTTLLRLLAGVTLPTHGRVRVEGRVTSLISLGMGFHPDLTGRENVHLFSSLMGFDRRRVASLVETVLEFADLGEYGDVAFKRYSSGMMARLGFAAAIHVDPGILLLDEVLAVGDHTFQARSMARLFELASRCTVVFVSHDLQSVQRLTQRAIWLDGGRIRAAGPTADVIAAYLAPPRGSATGLV